MWNAIVVPLDGSAPMLVCTVRIAEEREAQNVVTHACCAVVLVREKGAKPKMSVLKETVTVDCPIHEIMALLSRYFTERHGGREPGTVTLCVDMAKAGLPGHVKTSHDVKIVSRPNTKAQGVSLAWDPGDEMMPKFAGALHATRQGAGQSALTLEGRYDPPLGLAGKTFDAVLGNRIASATAASFLQDVSAFIESAYQRKLQTTLSSSPKE